MSTGPASEMVKGATGLNSMIKLLEERNIGLELANKNLKQEIDERKRTKEELSMLNLELEERVKQRTVLLQAEVVEHKQAEEKLRKNNEMLQMIFDGISDPLVMFDNNLEIRLLNRAASEYYHVEQKNVIGKLCYNAFEGRSTPCEACNIPILRDYVNEMIPIIDDYAKEHENLELCSMTYLEFRKDIFTLVDNIENGSRRINIAVSNLRGISRTEEKPKMEWIDVKELIEKSVSICRSKINRMVKSFEMDIPDIMPRVYIDSEAIEIAIINLLINAAQAVDKDNSWIRLNVTLDDSSQNDLIIEVSDNGCGLDEKIKNHIFDPFFTTKSPAEGTGLGLALCHNSIEKLGGPIEVDSVLGKGSTFKVTLPGNDTKK